MYSFRPDPAFGGQQFHKQRALQKKINELLWGWEPPDIKVPADLHDAVVGQLAEEPERTWYDVIPSQVQE